MDIGRLSVMLTGNANPLIGAIGQTQRAINGLAEGIAPSLAKATGQVTGVLGKLLTGNFTGAFTGVLGGITGAFWGLVGSIKEGGLALGREGMQAAALGLDVTELRVAMRFAGAAADVMADALGHLQGRMIDLQMGSAAAGRDLAGLAQLSGTSADALKGGGWGAVAEAIAGIADPAQRAGQAFRFFGDKALPLLNKLKEGGVGEARSFVKRMGLEVSGADLANVQQLNKVLGQFDRIGAGVFNQVLLGVAPVVNEVAKLFDGVKIDLSFIKPLVISIAEGVGLFAAFLRESARTTGLFGDGLAAVWKGAEAGFHGFKAVVLNGIADIAEALKDYLPKAGTEDRKALKMLGLPDAETAAGAMSRYLAMKARVDAAVGGAQAKDLFGALGAKLDKTEWGKGVTDAFSRIREAARDAGTDLKDAFSPLLVKELVNQFNQMRGAIAMPADAFAESMTKIGLFEKAGLFAGQERTRGLLGFKAGQDLLAAAGMGGISFAPTAELNSREAYTSVARFDESARRGSIGEQIKAALDAIAETARRQAAAGEGVLRSSEKIERNTERAAAALAGDTGGGTW